MTLDTLSTVLWQEQELLELLLFKLTEQQALLASGHSRWIQRATDELERVLLQLHRTEVVRAKEMTELAVELGVSPNASLEVLANACPAPWDDVLAGHRRGLLTAVHTMRHVAGVNQGLLEQGIAHAEEALAWLAAPAPATYSPPRAERPAPAARLLDANI